MAPSDMRMTPSSPALQLLLLLLVLGFPVRAQEELKASCGREEDSASAMQRHLVLQRAAPLALEDLGPPAAVRAAAAASCEYAVGCDCSASFDPGVCLILDSPSGHNVEIDGAQGACIIVRASIESLTIWGKGTDVLIDGLHSQVVVSKSIKLMPGSGNLCMVGDYQVGGDVVMEQNGGTVTLCDGSLSLSPAAVPTRVRTTMSQAVFINAVRGTIGDVVVTNSKAPICIYDGLSISSIVEVESLDSGEVLLQPAQAVPMPIHSVHLTTLSNAPVLLGDISLSGDLQIARVRVSAMQVGVPPVSVSQVSVAGDTTITGIGGDLIFSGCPAPGLGNLHISHTTAVALFQCARVGNAVIQDSGSVTVSEGTSTGNTTIQRTGAVEIHGVDGSLEDLRILSVESLSVSDSVNLHPQVFEVSGPVALRDTMFGHMFLDHVQGAVTVASCTFEVLFVIQSASTVTVTDSTVNKDLVVQRATGDVMLSNNAASSGYDGFTLQVEANQKVTVTRNHFKAYFINANMDVVFEGNAGILFECNIGDPAVNRICGQYGTMDTEGTCFPIGRCPTVSL